MASSDRISRYASSWTLQERLVAALNFNLLLIKVRKRICSAEINCNSRIDFDHDEDHSTWVISFSSSEDGWIDRTHARPRVALFATNNKAREKNRTGGGSNELWSKQDVCLYLNEVAPRSVSAIISHKSWSSGENSWPPDWLNTLALISCRVRWGCKKCIALLVKVKLVVWALWLFKAL